MFDLFCNLRPIHVYPALISSSTLKEEVLAGGLDILIMRELTGDVYFGQPKKIDAAHGLDTMVYQKHEVERIAKIAFEIAKGRAKKVTSIDKAKRALQHGVLEKDSDRSF